MSPDHHLDVNKAVQSFLKHFESLSSLPLITNTETNEIFGHEVAEALAELDKYNQQENICQRCSSRCCLLVDCEVYDTGLNLCPVQSFRPLLCRMHFCNQFSIVYQELVKSLGDIFLESVLAAERLGSKKARLFDCPSFSLNIK